MIPRKKLQVFVSSTYEDLIEERQVAVQAILSAGHIPAGMELFAAGDESQMEVIRRWIDESDVFLLILGARYGSIEPSSGKSYVEREYEYARQKGKEIFSVVITEKGVEEKVDKLKLKAIERLNQMKLDEFRSHLVGVTTVKWWTDPKDITIAILQKLNELSLREDLAGWIRADQTVTSTVVAEEIARLANENASLRERLSKQTAATYSGLSFDEMLEALLAEEVPDNLPSDVKEEIKSRVSRADVPFKDSKPSLLHVLWIYEPELRVAQHWPSRPVTFYDGTFHRLERFGLIEHLGHTGGFLLTDAGKEFLLRLRVTQKSNRP
jgi:hypothetical protein